MKLSDLSPPKEIATPKWKFKLQEFWRCSTHHDRLDMQVMLRMGDRNGATKLLESWTPPQPATETTQPAKTPTRKFQYGSYGGWFYPGYHNNSGTDKSSDGADSNLGIQESQDIDSMLNDFTKQCCDLLGIKTVPKIKLRKDSAWSQRNGSFGRFDHDNGVIELALANRHPVDVMRTLAHELVHHRQGEVDENLPADAGKTGSRYEDEANAVAGQIMRSVAKNYPEVFGKEAIDEGWREKAGALATAACIAGSPGCATTADTVRGVQDVGRTVQTFKGYGTAGAKEELTQRLKNELRRRQGQLPEDIADEDYDATDHVNEAFDQPYRLRWEKGDHGDVDAIAKMDDGNYLSIMFNKGFSQDTKEEAWSVEFYRNNSQEVTGEGDAQRVFATVLSAIQTFIKKYKPKKVYFSASKEVDTGQNAQSRARLYDSLVQRYARAWGFRAFRADTGNKVMYELSRIKPMAEGQEKFNMDLMKPGFRWSQEINDITYLVRTQWDNMPEVIAKANNREVGRATFINHRRRSGLESVSTYVNPKWQGYGIAKNMYAVMRMLGANIQPSDTQTAMGKSMWAKWKQAGDTKHLTKLNAKPEQPGLAEATGYIPVNDKEARDPRYSMAITQDIKPGEVQRQARKMGFKTTAAGLPPTLKASGKL